MSPKKALYNYLEAVSTNCFAKVGSRNKSNRDEWLKIVISRIKPGSRILDAGAGQLQYKKYCEHLVYVSQDFGQYDGKGDGTGLQKGEWIQTEIDIVSDIVSIPQPDASFDAIMCIEVLEHLPNPIAALGELVRLLKPGGILILTAPFSSLSHYSPYYFHTGFSRYFYEHWLASLGMSITELAINGNYFEYLAQELRRLFTVSQKYTEKHMSFFEQLAVVVLLSGLKRFTRIDQGSSELLSFGIQIVALKN